MAGLKKPEACGCGSVDMHREYGPERWICDACETVVRTRQKLPNKNSCRDCDAKRGEKPFKPGKNLCMDCARAAHTEWKNNNKEHVKAYRSTTEFKAKRQKAVRKAIQKSPESFLRHIIVKISKPSYRKDRANKLEVTIDFDYVWNLWHEQQDGLCRITGLAMTHKLNDIRSISIDRIDSNKGYVPGNIQLVCKAVNLAKSNHTQEEAISFFSDIRHIKGLKK